MGIGCNSGVWVIILWFNSSPLVQFLHDTFTNHCQCLPRLPNQMASGLSYSRSKDSANCQALSRGSNLFGIPEALLSNWGTNVFSCLMWVTKNQETEHNGLPSPVHLWFSVDRHHVYMGISAVKQCKCIVNVTTQKNNCLFTGINVGRLSMEAVSIITLLLLSPSYSKLQQKPFVIVKNININILHVICSTKGLGNYLWKSK